MNSFPNRAQIENLRQTYPPETRGEVQYIDDAGQLGMKWDKGRALSLIPGVDSFRKLTEQELLKESSRSMNMEEQSQ